ncbi:MAG: hypothetical protein EHM47_02720 [Ignavibacteriales bacterium]|nr:MAG: hypothetical protein EHM47_02720 [Ignavibacteriales bacterium]
MKQPLPSPVINYLSKYGNNKWKPELQNSQKFDSVIIIPAINESENILHLLKSLSENIYSKGYKVLILFVINNSFSSSLEIKKDNQKTLALLRSILNNGSQTFSRQFNSSGLALGLIDASSDGLEMPDKTAGVGLARKTGMDIALTLLDYTRKEKKILMCLDADCTVEKKYIEKIITSFNNNDMNVAVVNYEHPLPEDEEGTKAIICYEVFLRHYELGLKYAGSEYSFQTVGSAMVCDHEAYIKIEGMNKQKAAEDFYFLEKLAKHYKINKINSTTVYPSARKSWRVPFGTGQRMNRFLANAQDEYLLYHTESFEILKHWLELFNKEKIFMAKDYLQRATDIHPELCNFLTEQNFINDWDKIFSNSKDERQIKLQKHRWFDGFRTLKLIHHLRDSAFPLINMFDALDDLFSRLKIDFNVDRQGKEIPDMEIQKKYLYALRKLNTL